MATQVRETAAGKSVSAYVVLNKKGEHVATVNLHYSSDRHAFTSLHLTADLERLEAMGYRLISAI